MAGGSYKKFAGGWDDNEFDRKVSDAVNPTMFGFISGEVAASSVGMPLGVARYPGRIVAVNPSALGCGKDDADVPTLTFDVKINGTSCLTTRPILAHVSGEAAEQKSTQAESTGSTQAVVNQAANTLEAGDFVTWDCAYSGAASPTTKVNNVALLVEVDPLRSL